MSHLYLISPSSVHAAGAKVKDLEDEADRLLEKLQPIKKLQDNLRRNISQIKELINQARKQANSVSHWHTDVLNTEKTVRRAKKKINVGIPWLVC